MELTERVQRTLDFVREAFVESQWFRDHPADGAYRWEHTLRVARLGAEIARAEGMDMEAMTIACLLHDLAYKNTFPEGYDWKDHGRDGARMARPFLEELGLPAGTAERICYAVAIHVDGKADFPGEDGPFAETVSDADNLDRFDVFRIYETLWRKDFYNMPLPERLAWLEGLLPQLDCLAAQELATATAAGLWRERLAYQREFYARLLEQTRAGSEERTGRNGV